MTGVRDDSGGERATDRWGSTRSAAAFLVATLLALILSAAAPAIELDSKLALAAWAVSLSGGYLGIPVVLVLGIAWLCTTGNYFGSRTAMAVLLTGVLLGVLGGANWSNEHVLKPAVASARPHIRELARLCVIPTPEEFYAMGDEERRTRELRHLFNTQQAAGLLPKLHPLIREHWLVETDYSFPSGHTLASVTIATAFTLLGFRLRPRPGWLIWLPLPWAVLVGWSRYLLQVHSTADITGGGLLGILLGLLVYRSVLWWLNHQRDENQTLNDHTTRTTI
jgi:phosphatidylglycerophosphatase B